MKVENILSHLAAALTSEAELGRGTIMRVSLPIVSATGTAPRATHAQAGLRDKMAASEPKLLIVDDDAGLRRQLAWTFEGYEILSAGDRESAVAQFTKAKPPVVMLDLGLPPDPDGAN